MFKKIFAIVIATILLLSFSYIYGDYLCGDVNVAEVNIEYIIRNKIPSDIAFSTYLVFLFYVYKIKHRGENYKFIILAVATTAMIFAHLHCLENLKTKYYTNYKGILQKQGYTTKEKINEESEYNSTYTTLLDPNGNEVLPSEEVIILSSSGGITMARNIHEPYLTTAYDRNLNIIFTETFNKHINDAIEELRYNYPDICEELCVPYISATKNYSILTVITYSMGGSPDYDLYKEETTKCYFLADGKELDNIDKYLKTQMIPFVVITFIYASILYLSSKIKLFQKKQVKTICTESSQE